MGEYSLLFRKMEGKTAGLHIQGITSHLGDKLHPRGSYFASGGEIKKIISTVSQITAFAHVKDIRSAHRSKWKFLKHVVLFGENFVLLVNLYFKG
jgi:hypothetical protein